MDKQQPQDKPKDLQIGRFYRCRPTMVSANVIGPYLVDIQGLNIQFFNLKDFTLHKRVCVISKQDQYCAQLNAVSPKVLVIFGLQKFLTFNIEQMQIVETVKTNSYIEKTQVRNNYIVVLSSDEDSQHKVVNCWRIDLETGKLEQKYKQTQFAPLDYEQCTQDNLYLSLIMSIDKQPKVYVYWKDTTFLIEIDPKNQTNQIYNRHHRVGLTFDLTKDTYAEATTGSIVINNKKTGKKVAELKSQNQKFTQIFCDGSNDKIYSLSNFGFKKWKLQPNCIPALYASSDQQTFKRIFFGQNNQVYGLNLNNNTIFIWKNPQQYSSYTFPNQTIRKIIKLDEHRAFFLLQASNSELQSEQCHVSKFHKLQIFDFNRDNQIAKKAMLKSEHSVDADSIVTDGNTVRFIVNEIGKEGEVDRKYLLKWTPFSKDENGKDTKKKEIKAANLFDRIKLYNFNKILGITLPKKSQAFSLFAKQQQQKTQIVLFDFGTKKIGDYDLQGQISNVQLSQKNLLYAIASNRVLIYSIVAEQKNRLQKINQLQISALSVYPIQTCLLVQKQSTFLLLDSEFECIMRQQVKQGERNYKIIEVSPQKFLLKTETCLQLWDTVKESVDEIKAPECEPNIVEFMNNKLIVADKWVEVYDIKIS